MKVKVALNATQALWSAMVVLRSRDASKLTLCSISKTTVSNAILNIFMILLKTAADVSAK